MSREIKGAKAPGDLEVKSYNALRSVLWFSVVAFLFVLVHFTFVYDLRESVLFKTFYLMTLSWAMGWLIVTLLQLARSEEELRERLSRMEEELKRLGEKNGN
jgi:hypothetical protein